MPKSNNVATSSRGAGAGEGGVDAGRPGCVSTDIASGANRTFMFPDKDRVLRGSRWTKRSDLLSTEGPRYALKAR
jgi:hypothetical protein